MQQRNNKVETSQFKEVSNVRIHRMATPKMQVGKEGELVELKIVKRENYHGTIVVVLSGQEQRTTRNTDPPERTAGRGTASARRRTLQLGSRTFEIEIVWIGNDFGERIAKWSGMEAEIREDQGLYRRVLP